MQAPDVTFIMAYCGISDVEARERVRGTQQAARAGHHVYKCIEHGMFASSRIEQHAVYEEVRRHFQEPQFKLLELGCCFGTDVRRLLLDGLEQQKVTASDLHDAYWKIGKEFLYKDEIPGVRTHFCDFAVPFKSSSDPSDLPAAVDSDFVEQYDAISAQMVVHVLSKEQCEQFLANALRSLKPHGAGILFGSCVGGKAAIPEWGPTPTVGLAGRAENQRFLHSRDSLAAALGAAGFDRVAVAEVAPPAFETEPGVRDSLSLGSDNVVRLSFSACRPARA